MLEYTSYSSTIKGLELGRVSNLPVTDQLRSSISASRTEDPFVLAKAIREANARKDRMPHKRVFGDDLPTSVTTISPLQEKNYK